MPTEGIHTKAPAITDEWRERWPDFHPREFACKHCGQYYHSEKFLDKIQALRYLIGRPLRINSGHRCRTHNTTVTKNPDSRSQHLTIAADIALQGHDRHELANLAQSVGFTGIGYGSTFLHVDIRPNKTEWFYPGSKQYWRRIN